MDGLAKYNRRKGHSNSALVSPPPEQSTGTRGRTQLRSTYTLSPRIENLEQMIGGSSSARSSKAAKILSSVRRSLSYGAPSKRRTAQGSTNLGMQSTAIENLPPSPPVYDFRDDGRFGPSIEQIAMGLHISRTPHLGPSRGHPPQLSRHKTSLDVPTTSADRPTHHRRGSAPVPILPPPPARSSMKKAQFLSASPASGSTPLTPSESNVSLSTLTSTTAPSTPRSNRSVTSMTGFSTRLHLGMNKLLISPRRKELISPPMSDTSSTPRKVVRFSSPAE